MVHACAVIPLVLVALFCAWPGGLAADEQAVRADHLELVQQLGSTSYAQREQAAASLRQIGIGAKPALMRGLSADDLEVRLGAHRILVQVMQSDFETRIASFIAGGMGREQELPGWALFRDAIGDGELSRRLFADMLRTENELLAAVESGGTEVEKTLAERIQFLTSANMIINGQRQSITPPTLATILFVGMLAQKSQASANGPVPQTLNATTSRIYSLLSYSTAHDTLLRGVYATQIRQLLASWIEGIGESNEQYSWSYALQLALRYELREQGPRIARKVLKDPGTNFSSVPYAAFVLGRFGSVEDAVHLEPYLSEEKVFHTWSNTALKKEPIRIEVRDAVLAMLIQLHGENPADYGYKLLQPDDVTIYKVYTLGFLEDAERVAAFAKWKARAAVQPSDSVAEEPGAARSATAAQEGPAQTPGTGG